MRKLTTARNTARTAVTSAVIAATTLVTIVGAFAADSWTK